MLGASVVSTVGTAVGSGVGCSIKTTPIDGAVVIYSVGASVVITSVGFALIVGVGVGN